MAMAAIAEEADSSASPDARCAINPEIIVIVNPAYAHSLHIAFIIGSNNTTTPMILAMASSILK